MPRLRSPPCTLPPTSTIRVRNSVAFFGEKREKPRERRRD
ncbi:unnamed protein product [Rhodiola kirilowii]